MCFTTDNMYNERDVNELDLLEQYSPVVSSVGQSGTLCFEPFLVRTATRSNFAVSDLSTSDSVCAHRLCSTVKLASPCRIVRMPHMICGRIPDPAIMKKMCRSRSVAYSVHMKMKQGAGSQVVIGQQNDFML